MTDVDLRTAWERVAGPVDWERPHVCGHGVRGWCDVCSAIVDAAVNRDRAGDET